MSIIAKISYHQPRHDWSCFLKTRVCSWQYLMIDHLVHRIDYACFLNNLTMDHACFDAFVWARYTWFLAKCIAHWLSQWRTLSCFNHNSLIKPFIHIASLDASMRAIYSTSIVVKTCCLQRKCSKSQSTSNDGHIQWRMQGGLDFWKFHYYYP